MVEEEIIMVHKVSRPRTAQFIIIGKMWHDNINGNTYHNTTVLDARTGKVVAQSGFTYGYGEQWKHTGYDMLVNKGLVGESDRFNHELNRRRFIYVDSGFGLKKEIIKAQV